MASGFISYKKSIEELTEALRLTVEYIGTDALPPVEGWSWYDAMLKFAPEKALAFRKEYNEREAKKQTDRVQVLPYNEEDAEDRTMDSPQAS